MSEERERIAGCLRSIEEWTSVPYTVHLHHYVERRKDLERIVRHGLLRLSRYDLMRDGLFERKSVSRMFSECIDDLVARGSVGQSEAERLKESVASDDIRVPISDGGEIVHTVPYIACFSPNREGRMWDEYDADASVDLMISLDGLDTDLRLIKVRYDNSNTRDMVKELIMDARTDDIDEWCDAVRNFMAICSLAVKSADLEYEQEYRLIYLRPEDGTTENRDWYAWTDISDLMTGSTLGRPDLYDEYLRGLAGKDGFRVDRFEEVLREDGCGDRFVAVGECPWCGTEIVAYRPGRYGCDNCENDLEVDSGGCILIPDEDDLSRYLMLENWQKPHPPRSSL